MLRAASYPVLSRGRLLASPSVFTGSSVVHYATASPDAVTAHSTDAQIKVKLLKSLEKKPKESLFLKSSSASDKIFSSAPVGSGTFGSLGLDSDIAVALTAQGIHVPTPVQRSVIPRILSGENLVMAASTGSGKTLAYTLPCLQSMHMQEAEGYVRKPKRPRCLVLVPTRELARQVLDSVKQIGHYSKVASTAVLGGEQYALQKKQLDRLIDVVVASPGRLMEHKKQGNVYFSQVTHVVIDEVDTMLTQGFGPDIRAILRSVIARDSSTNRITTTTSSDAALDMPGVESTKLKPNLKSVLSLKTPVAPGFTQFRAHSDEKGHLAINDVPRAPAQLVMATATLTKAVRALLSDVQGGFNLEYSDPGNLTPRKTLTSDHRVNVSIVEVDGVHRSLPNVKHEQVEVRGSQDKLGVLRDVLSRHHSKSQRTLIFCNTVASCRAVEYAINQDAMVGGSFSGPEKGAGRVVHALSYHGDLNSAERQANLEQFRTGQEQYLVCSDIAARGLDIPAIGHVVMFDFPLNPIDYLHRAGRCGRAGRKGLVTSLVAKRDIVLAKAIDDCIKKGLPIDSLTSDKKDYTGSGKLVKIFRRPRAEEEAGKGKGRWSKGSKTGRTSAGIKHYVTRGAGRNPMPRVSRDVNARRAVGGASVSAVSSSGRSETRNNGSKSAAYRGPLKDRVKDNARKRSARPGPITGAARSRNPISARRRNTSVRR